MKAFGDLLSYKIKQNKVYLEFENGDACIEIIRDDIINVFSAFQYKGHRSKAIEGEKAVKTEFTVRRNKDKIKIETSKITAYVSSGFTVDFYDKKGTALCLDSREERIFENIMTEQEKQQLLLEGHTVDEFCGDFKILVKKQVSPDECFYGLGDKTGSLNKRNYQYKMWNTDNPAPHVDTFEALYKTIPFLISLKNDGIYGLFFDNTFASVFNMAKENPNYYWYGVNGGNLDYYYIAGKDFKEILSAYTYLTGTTPLPQLWTLGYQQSRFGYMNEKDVLDIAKNMRKYDVPCDVIHIDIDYMDEFKVFSYNKNSYPDMKKTTKKLQKEGFKAVTIIDPGVKVQEGYDIYDEGIEKDYFCRRKNGKIYEGIVWPGKSVFPDFGRKQVRDWWGDKQKYLIDLGVSGTWNDMNEPADFRGALPDSLKMTDENHKSTHLEMHNAYGHNMAKATYEGIKKHSGLRPFVITRACYSGSQKYTTAWTGDNTSLWSHLQMAIPQLGNLGLSGMAFVGTDIGGFGGDTTPELLARWIEVGIFSPLCRNHCGKFRRNQEPWCFGDEVLDIYRKYVKLRYALLPYFYDNFRICEQKGYPIMRPLIFNYPEDKICRNKNDEFMVGDNLLVAPVVEQGEEYKKVYLPSGYWYDFFTGEKIKGGKYFIKYAPLDTCPIYV
ncbi:MAG: DUF4968 domain-containing protein, partial [Clostridiales bacterium]|nr:DUF4968 domain-containing protein [Candidatus Equinaster intestinalis]